MRGGWNRLLLLVGASLVVTSVPAAAQQSSDQVGSSGWAFIVAPYFLAPYMDGQLGIGILPPATITASPGDIFDKLQFGAMLYVEARKGAWGAFVDGLYMDLEQAAQRENVAATASAQQGAVQVSAFRRIAPSIDVLVGARVNVLDAGLLLPAVDTTGGQSATRAQSATWVDPLIGVRLRAPLPPPWQLGIMADIGGFSVGSKLAYQIYPMAGVRVSRLFSIHVAYRILDMDYETGTGSDAFRYDMSTYGPEIGLGFHF
jgi:hypothetical protein